MNGTELARRAWHVLADPGRFDRLESFARRHPASLGRINLHLLLVRVARRIVEVRVTGLAAEMTYYALISLLPLLTAVGAGLGFAERFIGAERVAEIETTVVEWLGVVFAQQVTDDVVGPLVRGLLEQERAGVAVGGVVVALWLASRMFRAAIRALDDAYGVPERRGVLQQVALGLALALGAVVTLIVMLSIVVVGPLLGGGVGLAESFGLGEAFRDLWGRTSWTVVLPVCAVFLTVLYRYGPNVRTTWRSCLPGTAFGTIGLVAVAVAFRIYLAAAGLDVPEAAGGGAAVRAAGQVIGMILAGVLWMWLSSIVLLTGGVLNAEVARARSGAEARETS